MSGDARYTLTVSPTARRQLAEVLPEAVAFAAHEFIVGPLLENPHRVGKRMGAPLQDSARRGTYRVVLVVRVHAAVIGSDAVAWSGAFAMTPRSASRWRVQTRFAALNTTRYSQATTCRELHRSSARRLNRRSFRPSCGTGAKPVAGVRRLRTYVFVESRRKWRDR